MQVVKATNPPASESGVRLGRSAHRMSKWSDILYRLRRSCFDSLASLLVEEIGRSVLRIGALLRKKSPYSRRALVIPLYPDELAHLSLPQENEYLRICNEDIQRLSRENCWAGHLDQQIMVQAHLAGARIGFRICISKSGESSVS